MPTDPITPIFPKVIDELSILDPDGDLVLVLNEEICEGTDADDDSARLAKDSSRYDGTEREYSTEVEAPEAEAFPTEGIPDEELETQPTPAEDLDWASQPAKDAITREIRMQVSSKHLVLVSTVFKAILQPNSQEGESLRLGSRPEIPLPDDDPAALLVLLNIIHGRFREVPRIVDLKLMTGISVLVDKYDLVEIAEAFVDEWLVALKRNLPEQLDNDLLPWMCISHVFQKSVIWRHVTRIAQLHCDGPLTQDDLPIPESALAKINSSRQSVLADVFSYLQSTLQRHQGSKRVCPSGIRCDAMHVGYIKILLGSTGMLEPPEPPYNGFSIHGVLDKLRNLGIPQFCVELDRHRDNWHSRVAGKCEGVQKPLNDMLETLEGTIQGLKTRDET